MNNISECARFKTIQLFVTCLVDAFYPETGMSVVRLLEHLGFEVEFPELQTCCGQIAFNAGLSDEARAMARHNIDLLSRTEGYIVLPSGSCTDMMTHHYGTLFADDPVYGPRAAELKGRAFEFTQFLVDELGITDLDGRLEGTVTYHPSCHGLRNLGLKDQSTRLLAAVEGLTVEPLLEADVCCGFGGLFAVKMSDISGVMLKRKLDHVEQTSAATLVGSDVSCLMHMAGGLKKRGSAVEAVHVADILCRACGLE